MPDMNENGETQQEYFGRVKPIEFEVAKGTKELLLRIAELEAQIEKMKCCENCQTVRDAEGNCYLLKDGKCKNKDKWELRR